MKAIAERCYEARDYALLNSNIMVLSKKHGQLKGAVQALVELVMGWLEEIKEREGMQNWLELVETLRSVTEGKVMSDLRKVGGINSSRLLDFLGDTTGPRNSSSFALP